jgi:Zn finger protein HypA/HybF involved in hydrogenase expression
MLDTVTPAFNASGVHELALMEDLISAILESSGRARVQVVRLQIGPFAGVVVEALRFCFDVCAKGTEVEGAVLDIERSAGQELRLKEVEVIDDVRDMRL